LSASDAAREGASASSFAIAPGLMLLTDWMDMDQTR
jgi:hypothetical protein